jgi:hypothetical protein
VTAQISDTLVYLDRPFVLAGVSGEELFEPEAHGLKPTGWSTAAYRGFCCRYAVIDDRLLLTELEIGLEREDALKARHGMGPVLFGRSVEAVATEGSHGPFVFRRLDHLVQFTGGLLAANDFIRELYVHMGFHPGWKYREVHELLFERGRLTAAHDRSEAAAGIRERMSRRPLQPPTTASDGEIMAWIDQCFTLNYERHRD